MYRHCIYCSADLGANEAVESFPVGRQVAFDAEKGRLWAVCPTCARWNLAPIEERWEAVEEAEKRFTDTRVRVQRENIGLASLRDGTRLVRIGRALRGELAAWRYGETLRQRRTRFLAWSAAAAVVPVSLMALDVAGLIGSGVLLANVAGWVKGAFDERRRVYRVPASPRGASLELQRRHVEAARLRAGHEGEMQVVLPQAPGYTPEAPLVVRGPEAARLLERTMVLVNRAGARGRHVAHAVETLAHAGAADAFLAGALQTERTLGLAPEQRKPGSPAAPKLGAALQRGEALALEMALHEEQERRALEGELTLLEAAWREAEEIAGIADRLALAPDGNDA